jgi:hypothetical protein
MYEQGWPYTATVMLLQSGCWQPTSGRMRNEWQTQQNQATRHSMYVLHKKLLSASTSAERGAATFWCAWVPLLECDDVVHHNTSSHQV